MSTRTRAFVLVLASFGLLCLATIGFHWHVSDPQRFFSYLSLAILCSFFQLKHSATGTVFAVSLPLLLISIVELSLAEAVVVGCCAALVQCVWSRNKLVDTILSVGMLSTVIATADFAYDSLLPASLHNPAIRLFVAALVLFVANTFPAAIAARLSEKKRLGQLWKEAFFWSFRYYIVGAAVAGVLHLASTAGSWVTDLVALPVIYAAYRYYRMKKTQLEEKQKHAGDMAALHLRAIEGLALAVEAKDTLNTRGHLRRVQVYALGVGKEMGLTATDLEALHAAALLHDIGKLAVPEHILTKPGKLSPEEFAKMKVHPLVGAEIVEHVQFPYPVAPIVRAHHEKWDGSGYPLGLKGEEIPIGARILTAVDCLDALTSDREYRKALPLDEAMAQISADAGKAFDSRVIDVLQRLCTGLEIEAKAQTERQAVVLSTHSVVEKGHAPAAGLDLCSVTGFSPSGVSSDFLTSITAARREEKMLVQMANTVGNSLDLPKVLQQIDDTLRAMIATNSLVVFLHRGNMLVSEYARGDNHEALSFLEVPVSQGLAGWVAQNLQPVVNGNPSVDPGFSMDLDRPLQSALAVPLEGAQTLLGVLVLYRRDKDAFTRDELRILTAVTPKIAHAIENALKYKQAEVRANVDSLTALPNAKLIHQTLEVELVRAHRFKQSLAVVMCKLDGYEHAVGSLGQASGDQLLRNAAHGLREAFREYDTIGRIGASTFALVLPGMKTEDLPAKLATLAKIGYFITGEALYPDDGDRARQLMSLAERRLSLNAQRQTTDLAGLRAAVRPVESPAEAPSFVIR